MIKKRNDINLIKNINGKRKKEHLSICLTKDISFKNLSTGFEKYRFMHQALPEIDFNEIDLTTEVFGKRLGLPIMISPLTGGIDFSEKINKDLAHAAQISQIAMGVGSQRIAVENPQSYRTFQVRKYAPDILLLANLGAVQLNYGFGPEQCRQAVEKIKADGLMLHVNSLHEAFQHEGNHNFKDLAFKDKGYL